MVLKTIETKFILHQVKVIRGKMSYDFDPLCPVKLKDRLVSVMKDRDLGQTYTVSFSTYTEFARNKL